jgi:hypothetical protein
MRFRVVFVAAMLAAALAPALVAAESSSSLKFTVAGTGVTCVMTTASVSCQTATSAVTVSAVLTPDGRVARCRQPQGSSPGCVLWPGAVYENLFITNPEPRVGGFACIPLGVFSGNVTGVVCTVVATGKGFRITTGNAVRLDQISPGPHPPCTRAALTGALERAYHERSLAPSYLSKGWQCAGNYARGDLIDVHGGVSDAVTVVFRGTGRVWTLRGRGTICEDGEIPARLWFFACAVN